MPEQLDARLSDKHFLSAVDILQDALRLIRSSNLESIGGLADLKTYLNNQETVGHQQSDVGEHMLILQLSH